jgi:hypothetical protein
MSEFSKTFLRERIGDDKQPREIFGIFGKHPGWNDHIEDLPLPTASMAMAKQLLYVQGIGSQISSGAWARLKEPALLPDFDHIFLWVRGCQFLAGRMWASRDGKRRAHFPMVAVVHGINVARETALDPILTRLESVATGCQATRSAEDVRAIIDQPWSDLRDAAGANPDSAPATLGLARNSALKLAANFHDQVLPSRRLPADPADLSRSLRFWSRVCTALGPADTPLLFIMRNGAAWLDVLAGEPAPERFFCLRAGPEALVVSGAASPEEPSEEVDADELIKVVKSGQVPGEERSWISRLLRH